MSPTNGAVDASGARFRGGCRLAHLPMGVFTIVMGLAGTSPTWTRATTGSADFDWAGIVPFTLAATAATVAGRLPNAALNRAFAALLLLVASLVGGHNALALPWTSRNLCRSANRPNR